MASIGKLRYITGEFEFEWHIENYSTYASSFRSPPFSFAGEPWCLSIFPSGRSNLNSQRYVCLYLVRQTSGPPISLTWTWGLKTFDEETDHESQCKYVFQGDGRRQHGTVYFVEMSTLQEKKSELLRDDVLIIVCSIQCHSRTSNDISYTKLATCSYCRKESASDHKCFDIPIRCPTCSKVVVVREWLNHECETARVKANEKLLNELANMIDNSEHSDVTIRVKDKEFRLHRSILAARNPYFSSMFKTDMTEKNTGFVSIDDCEPDIFLSFIKFVYTGKVDTLSCDNVCALYEVADKYQEDQLKAECLCYMKNKISIDNFCDLIVLALKHDEKELLEKATDLFCKRTKEIVKSVKWQIFMQEFPTQANELHIKLLDFYDASGCMKCLTNST